MQDLLAYDFGFLRERYADEHTEYANRFDEVVKEFRNFLEMPRHFAGPLAMMSHAVDGLWHTFICHTPQYEPFCSAIYEGFPGAFLHHQPHSDAYPVPAEAISNFYRVYRDIHGVPPHIWFEDIPQAYVVAVAMGVVPSELLKMRWSGWPGW